MVIFQRETQLLVLINKLFYLSKAFLRDSTWIIWPNGSAWARGYCLEKVHLHEGLKFSRATWRHWFPEEKESQKEKVTEEEVDVPQYVSLWIHSCCCKWHFVLFYDWVTFCCTCVPLLLYLFPCRWTLSCFRELAMVNSAAVNTGRHGFRIMVFSGYIPRSGIAGSDGSLGNWDWHIHTTICKTDN